MCDVFGSGDGLTAHSGDEVEVSVVNIRNAGGNTNVRPRYAECLTKGHAERLIVLHDTDAATFEDSMGALLDAVCSEA